MRVQVERPSSDRCGRGDPTSSSSSSLVSIGTIECFTTPAARVTEGRLTDTENQRASIRIKIRPSVFIVETQREYTVEEMSTDALTKLIRKRTAAFKDNLDSVGPGATAAAKRSRKISAMRREGDLLTVERSVADLETAAETLPVVINVMDWTLYNEEEIRFDRKGNEGMEELVNPSHLDPETWELDRVTPLILNNATGVFYARHNVADIVVTKSQVTGQALRHPVIFRLRNVKVWINTPLQLAVPSSTEENKKILYQHPSLTRVEDLRTMAAKSKSVSALLIPGVTNFNPCELELLNKDAKHLHYFTAQCYFSKSDLTLSEFLKRQHEKYDRGEEEKETSPIADTLEEERKKRAEATLAACGTDLNNIATTVSTDYAERRRKSKAGPAAAAAESAAPISFKRPVTCFFRPSFDCIVNCIREDECGLQMHLFPCWGDGSKKQRTFVVSSDDVMKEIHSSGRFFNMTERVAGFLPDVDLETLKNVLRSPNSHSEVASLLFYNNADVGNFVKGLPLAAPSLADAIVELVAAAPWAEIRAAGEIARAISFLYRLRDDSECTEILFPDEQLMAERNSGGLPYYWHDPIRCVLGIYKAVMDSSRQPVSTEALTFVHVSVLDGVLTPFFDSVLKTGAWAIDEVRDFLRWILEDVLLKYTAVVAAADQPILDSVARLCVHWAIMQSGAENRGLCVAFSEEPPFIIEPGLSLENYTLSTTPEALMSGDNVAEKISKQAPPTTTTTTASKLVRVVPLTLPSGKFFKSGKDLTVLIVEPNDDDSPTKKKTVVAQRERLGVIDYRAPRILSEPSRVRDNGVVGFRHLKTSGVLTAQYAVIGETNAKEKDDDHAFAVDGAETGLSIDGKMEHVNLFLPGDRSPQELPVNATKQGKYMIRDRGLEAVFFEPLLSSLALDSAANEKRVHFDSAKLYEECLAPLRTGKIVIYPTIVNSHAGPGFDWLWRVLQKNYGLSAEADKFYPRSEESQKKDRVSMSVESLLSSAVKQLGGLVKKKKAAAISAVPAGTSSFSPSFVEIDTFLKQQLKNVLSTLLTRMTMIVSNSEVEIIKAVCEKVAGIILDSFYVSLDPEQSVTSILERISAEQNGGVFSDAEGFGFGITRFKGADVRRQQQLTSSSTLETLLNSLRAEERQSSEQRHSQQMKKIRNSSTFTARLIELIRDDDKTKRINDMLSEAVRSQQRTPPHMISAMTKPASPAVLGSSSRGASAITEKPRSANFTSSRYLYVPINPKHVLTDMQWLECMSAIEAATRDSAQAVRHFEETAGGTVAQLKKLLAKWNDIVDQVTCAASPMTFSRLKLEWMDKEATRIAQVRDQAERSRVALMVQGKVVNIEKYGIIAVSRSLVDVDFYVRLPNSWPSGNWTELVYSAVFLACIPLQVNISRGIMAASKTAMVHNHSIALASAEKLLLCQ